MLHGFPSLIHPKFNDDPSNLDSVPDQPAESAADTPTVGINRVF